MGVANIAGSLASKLGLNAQGALLGLLHDLGKYSDEFQTYLQSAVGLINPDEGFTVDGLLADPQVSFMRNTVPTAYTAVPTVATIGSGHVHRNHRSR